MRHEAAYTEASQRLVVARRGAAEAQTQAHQLHVQLLQLSQQAEAASTRRTRKPKTSWPRSTARWKSCPSAASPASALRRAGHAAGQHAGAPRREEGRDPGRAPPVRRARATARGIERQAQEAQFQSRALAARRGELQRAIEDGGQPGAGQRPGRRAAAADAGSFNDAAAQAWPAGRAGPGSSKRSRRWPPRAASTTTSRPSCARPTSSACSSSAAWTRCASRSPSCSSKPRHAQPGGAVHGAADRRRGRPGRAGTDHRRRQGQAVGPARRDRPHQPRDRGPRRGEPGGAGRADGGTRAQDLPRRAERRPERRDQHAGRRDPQDRPGNRDLLMTTFNQVNEGFGRMFPSLFGGGQARLIMTGDEVLDAGVQVMAQPPGKKNSTIHLLSGGEKALTAIALVFAIFLLNPAPFCLLDEVDAPLDDANTERYAKLVSEMSKGTQFLFISHNKIAMEMAEQLIGVTMQEQGVSRIVAVDMEAAVSMAEAA
ncbi:MAG: hypothetical protein U1F53_19230 [Burkholderiaceae bacterium]